MQSIVDYGPFTVVFNISGQPAAGEELFRRSGGVYTTAAALGATCWVRHDTGRGTSSGTLQVNPGAGGSGVP